MRRHSVPVVMLLTILAGAGEKQANPGLSFRLPKPHLLDMRGTLKCSSVASASLRRQNSHDAAQSDQLVAEAKAGADNLELTLVRDVLLVREIIGTQKYKLVGNTDQYLSAVFVHDPDVSNPSAIVKSIVMDKRKGFAVWSISEPTDVVTDIPYAEMIYLTCQ
jgi:hypothetical protein